MNLRTDTEAEQWQHYPTAMARKDGRPWPTRSEWAEQVRTVNQITVNDVRERVSRLAEEYATAEEIAAAVTELRAQWKAIGRDVRTANAAARAVFPRYDQKADRAAVGSWYDAWDALTPDEQAAVMKAKTLTSGRKELHELMRSLERGFLDHIRLGIAPVLPPDVCPTFGEIHRRRNAAQDAAADEYVRKVENHPIDDAAWSKELARREDLERWFRDGPIVRRIPA